MLLTFPQNDSKHRSNESEMPYDLISSEDMHNEPILMGQNFERSSSLDSMSTFINIMLSRQNSLESLVSLSRENSLQVLSRQNSLDFHPGDLWDCSESGESLTNSWTEKDSMSTFIKRQNSFVSLLGENSLDFHPGERWYSSKHFNDAWKG